MKRLTSTAACLLAAATLHAETTTVRGRVLCDTMPCAYEVRLVRMPPQGPALSANTDSNGEFRMNNVDPGDYRVSVVDNHGRPVAETFATLGESRGDLEIRLPARPTPPAAGGAVSLAQMAHKIPRAAMREFKAAAKANRRGDPAETLSRLRKAVERDPEFALAHSNIAALLMEMKSYDEALAAIEAAERLDKANPRIALNRAVLMSRLGRWTEAEVAARRAVRLDPLWPHAQYALGVALLRQGKTGGEAVQCLERAAASMPEAARIVARVKTAAQPLTFR